MKDIKNFTDESLRSKNDLFSKKMESNLHYVFNFSGNLMSFKWVDEIESVCPYIDKVIRSPKLILIQEETVEKTERARRIMVASIKDLSRHTNYITKVDKVTNDVEPSKILDIRNEETFNIYENRFLYTLVDNMNRYILKKEDLLNNFEINNKKILEYSGSSNTKDEKIKVALKITSSEDPKENNDNNLENEIENIKHRIKRIKEYITSWYKSDMFKALAKLHVAFIIPPIKKTNIILKNPNFQLAVNLWNFLQAEEEDENNSKDTLNKNNDNNLLKFMDLTFKNNFYVLDSISKLQKEQKDKLIKYSLLMLTETFNTVLDFLIDNKINISEEELLSLISQSLKIERTKRLAGKEDIKKKFKSAFEEYLEKKEKNL